MALSTTVHGIDDSLPFTAIDDIDYSSSDSKTEDVPEKAPSWSPWGPKTLKRLVLKAGGAVNDKIVAFLKSQMPGTKVIFVMGQTGTGKSTILKEMTGLDLKVGKTTKSGTLQYEVCPACIDGEQYIFVDTPGFGAADMNNMDIFKNIMSCLTVLGPFVRFSGVLFVFGQPGTRISSEDLRTIRFIKCFCGPEFFANITFITSRWDDFRKHGFRRAWVRAESVLADPDVQQILNPPGQIPGGSVYHHGFPKGKGSIDGYESVLGIDEEDDELKRGDELRALIRRRYREHRDAPLQVLIEMSKDGREMLDTQAAKALGAVLERTDVQICGDRATIRERNLDEQPTGEAQLNPGAWKSSTQPQNLPSDPSSSSAAEPGPSETGKTPSHPGHDAGQEWRWTRPGESTRAEPSWTQRLGWWAKTAWQIASFFQKARNSGYQSTNRKSTTEAPEWSFWDWAKSWWTS